MKRSCSDRMWLDFFPSIESSDASLIKIDSWRILAIVPERCQRKSPTDRRAFGGGRGSPACGGFVGEKEELSPMKISAARIAGT
jgi:hypothetical protein